MTSMIVQSIVRHLLTAFAGGFAVKYGIDGSTVDAIVSGGTALAGVGWAVWDKKRKG